MPKPPDLLLAGMFPAYCDTCKTPVDITIKAVHTGTDMVSGEPVHKAALVSDFTHTCPASEPT